MEKMGDDVVGSILYSNAIGWTIPRVLRVLGGSGGRGAGIYGGPLLITVV